MMTNTRKLSWLLSFLFACAHASVNDLRITEFLASNDSTLADFEGDFPDWVEIHNSGATTVSLMNLFLTDDPDDLRMWEFPATTTLMPDAFLIVFCSGKAGPTGTELHAPFRLSAGGEYLALTTGSAEISAYSPSFPPQEADVSYGVDSNGNEGFFSTPTPRAPNGEVDDTSPTVADLPIWFTVPRGIYSAPFDLFLVADGEIRYTMDGSVPGANSQVYTGAGIPISSSTVVRASTMNMEKVYTHSYIFLEDVLQQPLSMPGFPNGEPVLIANPGGFFNSRPTIPFDLEMDPAIVNAYPALEALQSLPTMTLTASPEDLFDLNDGVYMSTTEDERPISVEIIDPANNHNEQIDSGVENHSHNFQKRSLRLNFRSRYGNREWVTPFFQNNDVLSSDTVSQVHRTLILRSGNNRSWARDSNPDKTCYCLDQMVRDTQIAMSGSGAHGVFVHMYINAVYWGVYNVVERPDDEFLANYFGGDDADYFYTNHGLAGNRDSTRWDFVINELTRRDMSVPENYAEMQEYVDIVPFIDYILLASYYGITDWPGNNFYLGNRNGADPTPTRFFVWDSELAMDIKHRVNLPPGAHVLPRFRYTGCGFLNVRCISFLQPAWDVWDDIVRRITIFLEDEDEDLWIIMVWQALLGNADFRELVEDRIDLHTAGVLSDAEQLSRWDTLTDSVALGIIGESARWGDSLQLLGYPTRTVDGSFEPQVATIRSLIDGNKDRFMAALREANLYNR